MPGVGDAVSGCVPTLNWVGGEDPMVLLVRFPESTFTELTPQRPPQRSDTPVPTSRFPRSLVRVGAIVEAGG